MLHILNEINARHFGWHLILLIVLVFICTPILKHLLFKRARNGSVWLPPRRPEVTPGQARQARRYLAEQRQKRDERDADDD